MTKPKQIFAGYIPVLHDGYIRAFDRHPDAIIGIFNDEVLNDIDYIRKDIRSINPVEIKKAIVGLGREAVVIGKKELKEVLKNPVVMPDDDISKMIIERHPQAEITLDPVFLRWDRENSVTDSVITPDRIVTLDDTDPVIMKLNQEFKKSTNWWRHLGVVITDDNDEIVLCAHNSSVPTEYTSWIDCDPRITAKKGEAIERSIDMHAEARVIAEAANRGVSLNRKNIYVSTFPCPNCAKLIAASGIKKCFYIEGYSVLDGFDILKAHDVEVIKIDTNLQPEDSRIFKQYPEN